MTDSSSEAVDVSSLLMLRQMQRPGSQDAVARIVDRFLEEAPERVTSLRTAIQNSDAHMLEQAAHVFDTVRGSHRLERDVGLDHFILRNRMEIDM